MARNSLAWMLTCLMLFVSSALYAQPAARKHDFDIKKVSLSDAIRQFSMSTGLQILYLPDSDSEERQLVGPVKGSYTPAEALTELLAPTGLKFSWVNDRTIGIERPPPPPPPPPPKPVPQKGSSTTGRVEPKRETSVTTPRPWGVLERLMVQRKRWVEGSIEDGHVSVLTFDRSAIEQLGASTVSDVIENISPQTYMRPEGFRLSGAQHAELRGLGFQDYTLVLIDGQRAFPSAANLATSGFDLNTIPLTAVERIEVLLDSGSVAYGTDTVGGIVNVILRKEIPAPVGQLQYGAVDGGAEQRRGSFGVGHTGGELSATLFADYFEIGELIGEERERWRNQDFRRYGGPDVRTTMSSPGNVSSVTPFNLPGLSSRFAAVPLGSSGNTIDDFVPTAGTFNRDSLFEDLALVPDSRRVSVMGHLEAKLAGKLAVSADVLHVDRSASFQQPPPIVNAVVPQTNPFNPFDVPVMVQAQLNAIGPQTANVETKLLRAVAALRGEVSNWGWELSLLDATEDAWVWTENVLDPVRLAAALASPDRAQALDVFNDGPGGSPELLASLIAPRRVETFSSDGRQVRGMLAGTLLELPAGNLTVVTGGEWRREEVEFDAMLGSFDRNVSAGFAELRVPVVDSGMSVPLIEELALTLAARWNRYSDFGDVTNPQFGVIWRPHRDVTVRAGLADTFRPPSLFDLYFPKFSVSTQVLDPRRPGAPSPVTLVTGGNRDLAPIEGQLLSAGLAFTPSVIPGLKINANAWRIEVDERITFFAVSTLLANEAAFPERVIRAAPTPQDIAAGRPGQLLAVDISRRNLGRLETSGLDLNLSYDFDTRFGRFVPGLMGTWIDEFETLDVPGTAKQDRINVASELGTIVRWRAAVTLGWGRGPFSTFAAARYVPSYDDASLGVRTGQVVSSQTTFDVQGSIDLGRLIAGHEFWEGMRLTLGATNVTDEMPPFSQANTLAGFDFSQGDLKGRFAYLRLGKTF